MILMNIPSIREAEKLLSEAESKNPGRWVMHAKYAALAAKNISSKIQGMDPERSYILGLLHDIGRREGVTQMRHIIDGYDFMTRLGYDHVARINLTHSFAYKHVSAAISKWDCTKEQYDFIDDYINNVEYDDYDRLIQLCDCLSLAEGFCLIEKRMIDIILRYGTNDKTTEKIRAVMNNKKYFEGKTGCSIYDLLPGVIENSLSINFV
jgi:hypothetical protein